MNKLRANFRSHIAAEALYFPGKPQNGQNRPKIENFENRHFCTRKTIGFAMDTMPEEKQSYKITIFEWDENG